MPTSPTRYAGAETPTTVEARANRSTQVPRHSAETTPVSTPSNSHRTAAPIAIEAVTGKYCPINVGTGSWSREEEPEQGAAPGPTPAPGPKPRPAARPRREPPHRPRHGPAVPEETRTARPPPGG